MIDRALALYSSCLLLAGTAAAQEALPPESFAGAPDWLRAVYEERSYEPVWSENGRPSEAFGALLDALAQAEARGLDPQDYSVKSVERLARERPAVREQGASLIFAAYAVDLIEGRTPPEIDYEPSFEPQRDRRRGEILQEAYARGNPVAYLSVVTPDNFLAERLIEALDRYRGYARRGGWDPLPTDGDVLISEGDEHELVPALAERLAAEGFLAAVPRGGEPELYDERLASALKRFQKTRSMKEDGVVGPNTIEALNETPEALADRLLVNIERARWLPTELGDRAAFVNAADFTLRLFEDGRKIDEMDVIVGEEQAQTPVFADTMETVVVNPYWNVPRSILVEEIAPKEIENPGFAAKNDYEVLMGGEVVPLRSVDWRAAAAGEPSFRIRQKPGEKNALGKIKFLFPNEYAVYLHDTPAESLFSADIRTFSHGCIRVEDPIRFGAWILNEDPGTLRRMIETEERQEITAPELPVYITYFTAWAEPGEPVAFARDVYDRDAAVLRNLKGPETQL